MGGAPIIGGPPAAAMGGAPIMGGPPAAIGGIGISGMPKGIAIGGR
jgi:hypothetical protein